MVLLKSIMPTKIIILSFILYCFVLLSFDVRAQQLPFANLKISDGLEDTVVFSIEQDKFGFLWIATRTGINRYDGSRFWTYGKKDGLPHSLARDLLASSDGTLWAASESGLAWFDGVAFQALSDWPEKTSARALSEASDGTLWVATYGSGLVQVQTGEYPQVLKVLNYDAGMPSDRIRSVFVDKQDNIWAGFSNKVVRVTNGEIKKIDWHIKKTEIRTFYQHTDGSIWAGTRNGIARFDGKAFELLGLSKDLSNQTINIIMQDNEENIWIGTRDYGVYKIDKTGGITHLTIKDGLPDNSVNHIFQDAENNVWFGSYGGGISRLSTSRVLNWKSQVKFPNPNVYSIVSDSKGCFWFSTNGNGVSRLCNSEFTHFTKKDGLPNNKVLSVMVDNKDGLWFGTLDGVSQFKKGKFFKYTDEEEINSVVSYQVIQARDESYWIATNAGLNHFKNGKFTRYSKVDGLPDNRINRIFESPDGSLWLATASGLSKYQNNIFTNWTVEDGLPANFINDIFADKKGGLWIASNNGLSYFHQGKFKNWTTVDGLPHNNCTVILSGHNNEMWIGTSRGVAIFDGNNFTVITSQEGLVYDLINRGAGYRDNDGNLWFGTGEGVSRFAVDFKPGSTRPPPVHLISVNNNHERLDLDKYIEIKQEDSSMKFNYAGISFQRASDVNYRYRLNKGAGSQWRETRLSELQIDSLSAGDYTFEVTARVGQGQWNSQPAKYNFKIIPPFWKTFWFMGLLFASMIAAFVYRNYRIKQYSITLENEVKERTKQLEKVNQGLAWLANHDSLTRLANRNNVREKLESLTHTPPDQLGVIIIDLDYFKSINDEYGHIGGDKALEMFAAMLQEITQDNQLAARWGGEEFLIICPQSDNTKLENLAKKILYSTRQLVISLSGNTTFKIRCSIGLALSLPNEHDWKKAIQLADIALYDAKHNGRNCAVGYLWNKDLPEKLDFSKVFKNKQQAIKENSIIQVEIV